MVKAKSKKHYHHEVKRGQIRSRITLGVSLAVLHQITVEVTDAQGLCLNCGPN